MRKINGASGKRQRRKRQLAHASACARNDLALVTIPEPEKTPGRLAEGGNAISSQVLQWGTMSNETIPGA